MKRMRVLIIGAGERGRVHMYGLLQNPDMFQIVGVCNRDRKKAQEALRAFDIREAAVYPDIDSALQECRPEIAVVCLPPSLRLNIIEKIASYHVKGIMLEKPMALSLAEARSITKICEDSHIKAAVCHQHKYLKNFQLLKDTLNQGELGDIVEIRASCRAWSAQLGTHYIDYMMWINGYKEVLSTVGHIHGNVCLADSHPSPDYLMGQMAFANGVRGIVECGYFSKSHSDYCQNEVKGPNVAEFWTDDRLTVNGTKGYAYAELNGKFAKFTVATHGEIEIVDYMDFFQKQQYYAQIGYTKEFGEWLSGDREDYSCDICKAMKGFEVMEAMYFSALDLTRVDLPVSFTKRNALEEMGQRLGGVKYIQL